MANTLTPIDVYQLMNSMAKQALGENIAVTDTSSFVSVGEKILRTGTENALNALSIVLSKTIFSTRPYRAKFDSLRVNEQRWGGQVRKITYLYSETEQSTDYNTNLAPNQLADGNSIDMYKIRNPKVVQLNFYGTKKLQKHITRYRDQLSIAFQSEYEFIRFLEGVMVEFNNEIEIINEAKARGVVLNFMAGIMDMNTGTQVVDLVAEYNTAMGTTYTRDQLLGNHIEDFMKFVAAQVKIYSSYLTDIGFNYHANITGADKIPRHTPKARQKMLMYEPLFITAQSRVYASLFNPKYLEIGDYEGVNFWQSPAQRTSINITPNILNVATGNSVDGNPTKIDYVLGLLYDEEALGIMPQYDYSSVTPFNSAGGYYNMFMHWRFNSYNDFTENAILFILGDGGAGQIDVQNVNIYSTGQPDAPVAVTKNVPITVSDWSASIGKAGNGFHGIIDNQPIRVTDTAAASDQPMIIPENSGDDSAEPQAKTRSKK